MLLTIVMIEKHFLVTFSQKSFNAFLNESQSFSGGSFVAKLTITIVKKSKYVTATSSFNDTFNDKDYKHQWTKHMRD